MAEGIVMEAGARARRGSEGSVHARPKVVQPCGGRRGTWPFYTLMRCTKSISFKGRVFMVRGRRS